MSILFPYAIAKMAQFAAKRANAHTDTLTEDQTQAFEQLFQRDIGLGKDFKFDDTPFQNYVNKRQSALDDLLEKPLKETVFKSTENASLVTALSQKEVRQLIRDTLSQTPQDLSDSHARYKQATDSFAILARKIPKEIRPEAGIQVMKSIIEEGVQSLEKQQAFERTNLEALFSSDETPFCKLLNDKGVTDRLEAQKIMRADLNKYHEEQLKTFQDATAASLNQIHVAAKNSFAAYNFLNAASLESEKMAKAIRLAAASNLEKLNQSIGKTEKGLKNITDVNERAIAEKKLKEEQQQLERMTEDLKKFKAHSTKGDSDPNCAIVTISDFNVFYSKTGKEIHRKTKEAMVNGELKKTEEFSLELGSVAFSPFYEPRGYFMGNALEHDMKYTIDLVLASGHSKVLLKVDYTNQAKAEQRAKEYYQAALDRGIAPKDIRIEVYVKGQLLTGDKAWKPENHIKNLAEYQAKADQKAQEQAAKNEGKEFKFEKASEGEVTTAKAKLAAIIKSQNKKLQSEPAIDNAPAIEEESARTARIT